ncbi:MAG: sulfate adenylyltransferase subunit 2, partial [Candidatus Omnitrophica bacterium]|nr:sulfate adenylyltransferase subunit 2 [Candidatus Omnitrophota bacterium]
LEKIESKRIYIIRDAYACFKDLGMLWSIGKDSTVMLHLARKAFFGHVPFPLIHIDTKYKIPEMIEYRDRLTKEWKLNMIYGVNEEAIKNGEHYPGGKVGRVECCKLLKTTALKNTLMATGPRYRFDHNKNEYVPDTSKEIFTGIIAGIRSDEEGSRSKERYFSVRDKQNVWEVGEQAPEFWNQFNTDFAPGTHLRIHPLLDWTELNVWEYIKKENIPTVSLYYDQGEGKRYRSLGCYPCTYPVDSTAKNVDEIIQELKTGKFSDIAERSGRAQDAEDGGGLETLRRDGYM